MNTGQWAGAGQPLKEAKKVLIMLHGRGATAENILTLADNLQVDEFALLAPQAANNSWYPFSFLSPVEQNEPWLSASLQVLGSMITDIATKGIATEHIYFLGFSQGACLMLEYMARNATRYGGAAALTGGLIGDTINADNYHGDFAGTPVFIGTSDPDPHVPVQRVHATTTIFKNKNAAVIEKVYANMGHTINQDELDNVNKILSGS